MITNGSTPNDIAIKLNQGFDPNLEPESPYPVDFVHNNLQPAAVLLPFLRQDDEWRLLFIRRTFQRNDRHGGQVAFPGGRCDRLDLNAEGAALREAYEETGVDPKDVKLLGRIQDMVTTTGYRVTPIAGVIPWPYDLSPQPDEVSRIFSIPLMWLADPTNREVKHREFRIKGKLIPVIYYKPFNGEVLWGASARITLLLLEALGLSHPEQRYA